MISIIVPFYNSSKYIKDCIKSILNQTYTDFELLLINDGSNDDSLDICMKFKDKRINIFNLKHNGVSFARNYGLLKAKGDYICFVDSDDIIDCDYLKLLINNISDDIDFVECDFSYTCEFVKRKNNKIILTKRDLLYRMYSDEGIRNNLIVNKLFKRKLFDEIRFENVYHEDEFIIHKIFSKTNKALIIDDVLYYYRIHYDSRQREINKDRIKVLKVFEERKTILNENNFLFLNYCATLNHIIYLYCVFYKYNCFDCMFELYNLFIGNFDSNHKYSLKLRIKYFLFRFFPKSLAKLLLLNKRFKYA
ncbi:MAG: glycosyltransferase family 2 protein [Bacilli bacterium]|nr:glycosyltransferase family 2 protein [Bacilli bacterium]